MITGQRQLNVTDADRLRLHETIRLIETVGNPFRGYLRQLSEELLAADVVPAAQVEPDVVTMNSQARVRDLATGVAEDITLVYPTDADILRSRLSVLSPLGIELFGQRAGDTIEWSVPGGVRRLRIDRILFQPEAAGQFHL